MTNRNAFERRTEILKFLSESGRASTRQLSAAFGVSEVTIRSDLAALEESGRLARQHGGAELARMVEGEQSFAARRALHLTEKVGIARAAASLIAPGDHIMLDASTTAYQLAWELRTQTDITVITSNVQAGLFLAANERIEVLLLGGQLRGPTTSIVGLPAVEMLGKLHARFAFVGAAGVTLERGLTDADLREVQVKQAMIEAAEETVLLLDASKFGLRALRSFAAFSDLDWLVTDTAIPLEYIEACRAFGIQCITA